MNSKPTREFATLLIEVYAMYGKPMPDAPVIGAWWKSLAPFPQNIVAQAFSAYALERPDFAPVPNSIAARCRLLDGRPDENEAWAIAATVRDELATVVWTEEMAAAWNHCCTLAHDEVAARMAFKGAYARLVAEARAAGRPAKWTVSEGADKLLKAGAVRDAVRLGRIAPEVAKTLQVTLQSNGNGPLAHGDAVRIGFNAPVEDSPYPEGLKRVKALVATLEDPREKAARLRDERVEAEFEADKAAREKSAAKVRQYKIDHAADIAKLERIGSAKLKP